MIKSNFIVVGPIQSGKTYFISQIIKSLKNDIPCIGFIEKCIYSISNRPQLINNFFVFYYLKRLFKK